MAQAVSEYKQPENEQTAALTQADARWYPVGNPPRSIVIVRRGSKPVQTIKTASASHNPEFWQAFQPVLTAWLAERANGNKRIDHDKLEKDLSK